MQWFVEVLGTSMDGYGMYVWPAFLLCAAVMTVMAVTSIRQLRRVKASLRALESVHDEI